MSMFISGTLLGTSIVLNLFLGLGIYALSKTKEDLELKLKECNFENKNQ